MSARISIPVGKMILLFLQTLAALVVKEDLTLPLFHFLKKLINVLNFKKKSFEVDDHVGGEAKIGRLYLHNEK